MDATVTDATATDATVTDAMVPDATATDAMVPDATATDAMPDATATDAMPDATATDAMPDAGPTDSCMSVRCFAGQECTPAGCAFPCTGIMVPGDYATVQEAVSALSVSGTPVTICVAPGSYPAARLSGNITLVGASRELVSFAQLSAYGRVGRATVRGVTVDTIQVGGFGGHLRVEACRVLGSVEADAGTSIGSESASVEIDGCSLASTIRGHSSTRASAWVQVENSYIHDASVAASGTVSLRNCTLVGNTTGVFSANASVFNTLVMGSDLAFNFTGSPRAYSNNAIYNNTTNYAGVATPGPGEVRGDPLLTTDDPPVPMAGSPLIGAGLASEATAHDYWGFPRTDPDIGAVEAR